MAKLRMTQRKGRSKDDFISLIHDELKNPQGYSNPNLFKYGVLRRMPRSYQAFSYSEYPSECIKQFSVYI